MTTHGKAVLHSSFLGNWNTESETVERPLANAREDVWGQPLFFAQASLRSRAPQGVFPLTPVSPSIFKIFVPLNNVFISDYTLFLKDIELVLFLCVFILLAIARWVVTYPVFTLG